MRCRVRKPRGGHEKYAAISGDRCAFCGDGGRLRDDSGHGAVPRARLPAPRADEHFLAGDGYARGEDSAPRHLRDGPQLFGVAVARRPRCGRLSRRHRGADHHHRAFARRRRRHGDVRLPRQERRSGGARGSVRRYTILCYAEQCRPRAQPDPCRLRPRVSRGRLPRLDIQRRREQRSQHRPSQHRQIGAAARPSDRRHSRGRRQRQRKSEAGARGE